MGADFAWRARWVAVVATLFACVVMACSGSSTTNEPTPVPSVAPSATPTTTPDPTPAQSTIGPQGGEVRHPSGATLIVPPGALTAPVTITLTETTAPDVAQVGFLPVGSAFEAGPDGTTFQKPVEIRLPFEPTLVPNGATVGARRAPHGSNAFEALPATVDTAAKIVTTQTLHFTTFVAAADLGPGDDDAGVDGGDAGLDAGLDASEDSGSDAGTDDAGDAAPTDAGEPLTITTNATLPQAIVNGVYSVQLAATGGTQPYTWSKVSAAQLVGLSISASGKLSGSVSSTPGTYTIDLAVTDSIGTRVEKSFSITAVTSNPTPTIASISPSSIPAGSPDTVITITGTGFVTQSVVIMIGTPALATTYVSATTLKATVPASALTVGGMSKNVVVNSPTPGGGNSNVKGLFISP